MCMLLFKVNYLVYSNKVLYLQTIIGAKLKLLNILKENQKPNLSTLQSPVFFNDWKTMLDLNFLW